MELKVRFTIFGSRQDQPPIAEGMRRAVEIADPRPLRHAVRPLKSRGNNNKGVVALGARLWRAMAAQWEHFYALPALTLAAN